MRRAVLVVLASGLLILGVSPIAVAKASTSTATFTPSVHTFWDFSKCDDGGGTAVCAAFASVRGDGMIVTDASLRPAAGVATGGRAEGRGGPKVAYKLTTAYSAVRYSFFFEDVTARTQHDAATFDLGARSFVVGDVRHASCDACSLQVSTMVADTDPFTPQPAEVAASAWRIDAEMRNPDGNVPKGWVRIVGFVLSDVAMYQGVPAFASAAQAKTSGRLVRIEVEPIV